MNLTVLSLVRAASLGTSPFVSPPIYRGISSFSLTSVVLRQFTAPLISSANPALTLAISGSTFSNFLNRVAQLSALENDVIRTRQDFGKEFAIDISGCAFIDIRSPKAGSAFSVETDTHTLRLTNSRFLRCEAEGATRLRDRTSSVGGGAFIFCGGRSSISHCSFIRCTASSNTQAFHSYVAPNGFNGAVECFITRCGRQDIEKHTLFALDSGTAMIKSLNVTRNYVPEGYAGGIVGWFASGSKVSFSLWEYNVGKSIFGSCAYGTEDRGTELSSVLFTNNYATKYGVYMRHTGSSHFRRATFLNNTGRAFYGNAPLSLYRVYMDCDRPAGPIDEDSVAYNWLDRRTFPIRVPKEPATINLEGVSVGDAMEAQKGDVETALNGILRRRRAEEVLKKMIGKADDSHDGDKERKLRKAMAWFGRHKNGTNVLKPEFLLPHRNRTAEYFKKALERASKTPKV